MKKLTVLWAPPILGLGLGLALGIGALFLSGCDNRQENEYRSSGQVHLKAGDKVSSSMVGWVAMPSTSAPEIKKDDSKSLSYAILSGNNIVPDSMQGWVAINPIFFTKMSGVSVTAPAAPGEMWVMNFKGERIPFDKNGWVAVPHSEPQIESSSTHKGREMAKLSVNNVIPGTMNGWVAVDNNTLTELVKKFMASGPGSNLSKE